MTAIQRAAQIPPEAIQAEQAVLGATLLEGSGLLASLPLQPQHFYLESHRVTFAAMLSLHRVGRPVDAITVEGKLRERDELAAVGGSTKLAQLLEAGALAIPAHVPAYVGQILEAARKRELLALGLRITEAAQNGRGSAEIVGDASTALAELARGTQDGAVPLGSGLGQFLASTDLDLGPEVYVEGLLGSDGGGWIAGEEKLGKTYYALEEALCLALGQAVCGRFAVPAPRRVLFVEEEDGPRRTRTRIRALLRGHDLDPDTDDLHEQLDRQFRLAIWSGFSFDDAVMVERLRAAIVDFEPAVVYVDVLRKVTLRDLNKAPEASAVLAIVDELRRRYGVIFRLLHHYRKVQGFRAGRGSQEIGGSFVLGAWAESSLFFEPIGRKQGAVRVEVQTKDGAPLPAFRFRIESEGPRHAPTRVQLLAEDDGGLDEADEVVFQAVATLPPIPSLAGRAGASVQALAQSLKRSDKTIRRALKRLQDAGRVDVVGQASKRKDLYAVTGS